LITNRYLGHLPKNRSSYLILTRFIAISVTYRNNYNFIPAFIDQALKLYTIHVHNAGYLQELNERGKKKEDRSYEQLRYDFILRNVYFDYIDILRTYGLKPYPNAKLKSLCPDLHDILNVMCYRKKKDGQNDETKTNRDVEEITPHFQKLTKDLGQPVFLVFPQKILNRKDIRFSPLLPATWSLVFNIKANIDCKCFSDKQLNVFKKGKIFPGQKTNTLDNVVMSEEMHPPFETKTITRIYDLKPLRVADQVPIGIPTFYVLVFQPRKIREQDLKVYNRERKYVRESVLPKLRSPIFKIPALSKNDKAQKTTSKDQPNKVAINKTYLDEKITALIQSYFDLISDIETNEEEFVSVEESIGTFETILKANFKTAPKEFKNIRFPKPDNHDPVDTDDMEKSLLSLLETLQYGTFKNIFEAWRCIRGEPILPHNFSRDDLYHELELFQFESKRNILVWSRTPHVIELKKHFVLPKKNIPTLLQTMNASKSQSNQNMFNMWLNPS